MKRRWLSKPYVCADCGRSVVQMSGSWRHTVAGSCGVTPRPVLRVAFGVKSE